MPLMGGALFCLSREPGGTRSNIAVSVCVWVILCRQLSRADEDQCMECQAEHENEGLLLEDIGRLLGDVRASARFAMQAALTWLILALTPLRHLLSSHMSARATVAFGWLWQCREDFQVVYLKAVLFGSLFRTLAMIS